MTTALVTGGVALAVITMILLGWRRSAAQAREYKVRLEHAIETNKLLRERIRIAALAAPDMDEQRRMLHRIAANGGND